LVAQKISEVFYNFIKLEGEKSPGEVLLQVKQIGERLKNADQNNFVVPNMVKRILHIIRVVCKKLKLENQLK
jgi:translation initiation factor 2B subunit (eIF-2B alpha/beta/delta family)